VFAAARPPFNFCHLCSSHPEPVRRRWIRGTRGSTEWVPHAQSIGQETWRRSLWCVVIFNCYGADKVSGNLTPYLDGKEGGPRNSSDRVGSITLLVVQVVELCLHHWCCNKDKRQSFVFCTVHCHNIKQKHQLNAPTCFDPTVSSSGWFCYRIPLS
jgi:hypothetical protein